jgi:hypothetical protein
MFVWILDRKYINIFFYSLVPTMWYLSKSGENFRSYGSFTPPLRFEAGMLAINKVIGLRHIRLFCWQRWGGEACALKLEGPESLLTQSSLQAYKRLSGDIMAWELAALEGVCLRPHSLVIRNSTCTMRKCVSLQKSLLTQYLICLRRIGTTSGTTLQSPQSGVAIYIPLASKWYHTRGIIGKWYPRV